MRLVLALISSPAVPTGLGRHGRPRGGRSDETKEGEARAPPSVWSAVRCTLPLVVGVHRAATTRMGTRTNDAVLRPVAFPASDTEESFGLTEKPVPAGPVHFKEVLREFFPELVDEETAEGDQP